MKAAKTLKYFLIILNVVLWCSVIVRFWPQGVIIVDNTINNSTAKKPYLYITPVERDISKIKPLDITGSKVSFNQLDLSFPWEIKSPKKSGKWLMLDKQVVITSSYFHYDYLSDKRSQGDKQALFYFFGEKGCRSAFEFEKAFLQSSPAQITVKSSLKDSTARFILLNIKKTNLASPESLQKIFVYIEKNHKVIEYQYIKNWLIKIYNDQGDLMYTVNIFRPILQKEKDYILSSIKITTKIK